MAVRNSPEVSTIIDCLINEEETVISYQGANFYKACGVVVTHFPDQGTTECVRHLGHPDGIHEDWDGNTTAHTQLAIEGTDK